MIVGYLTFNFDLCNNELPSGGEKKIILASRPILFIFFNFQKKKKKSLMKVSRVQNKDHWGQGRFLRATIKLPSNCKGMKAIWEGRQGSLSIWEGHQGNSACYFAFHTCCMMESWKGKMAIEWKGCGSSCLWFFVFLGASRQQCGASTASAVDAVDHFAPWVTRKKNSASVRGRKNKTKQTFPVSTLIPTS